MKNCLGVMPFCLFIVFELSCIQIMWKHVVCFQSLKLKLVSEFSLSSDIPRTKGLKKNRNENKNHFVTLASIILNRHPFVFWKYIHVYLRFQSYMYFMGRNTKFFISYKTTIRPYCQYSSFSKTWLGCLDFMFNSLTSNRQHAGLIYCFHDNSLLFWGLYRYT